MISPVCRLSPIHPRKSQRGILNRPRPAAAQPIASALILIDPTDAHMIHRVQLRHHGNEQEDEIQNRACSIPMIHI